MSNFNLFSYSLIKFRLYRIIFNVALNYHKTSIVVKNRVINLLFFAISSIFPGIANKNSKLVWKRLLWKHTFVQPLPAWFWRLVDFVHCVDIQLCANISKMTMTLLSFCLIFISRLVKTQLRFCCGLQWIVVMGKFS